MAQNSTIEWTEATWNPVTGCTKISTGCQNCYAERMAKRLFSMGQPRYRNNFKVTLQHDLVDLPMKWKKSRTIFVNSMSDLFHKSVPSSYIEQVFRTMNETPWHTYQVLTKRPARLSHMSSRLHWSKNIWMGVSIEENQYLKRLDYLKRTGAKVKFLSLEPLIGTVTLNSLDNIDWVIVGGESGPGARSMNIEWARNIRDICVEQKVPFFFKQWGGVRKPENNRILDGENWSQYPLESTA